MTKPLLIGVWVLLLAGGCASLGRYTLDYIPPDQAAETPPPPGEIKIPTPGGGSVVVSESATDALFNELDTLAIALLGYPLLGRPVRRGLERWLRGWAKRAASG